MTYRVAQHATENDWLPTDYPTDQSTKKQMDTRSQNRRKQGEKRKKEEEKYKKAQDQ